jgi:hypothetical protein
MAANAAAATAAAPNITPLVAAVPDLPPQVRDVREGYAA